MMFVIFAFVKVFKNKDPDYAFLSQSACEHRATD